MEKLVLIDGNSIMNRAFYGIMGSKMLTTKDGKYTNAVYGFLAIMFKVMEELKPEYMMVTFDMKGPTKRHEMYKEYKANRHGMPDELAEQMPIIKEILNDFNIPYTYNKFSRFGNEAEKYDPYTGYPEEETYDISSQDDYSENYNKVSNQNYLVRPSEIQFQESSSIRTPEAREKYFSSFSKSK